MTIKHAVRSTTFNAAEQDSRCIQKSRALQKAYVAQQARRSRRIFAGKVIRSLMGTKLYEQAQPIFWSLAGKLSRTQ
jgi:hypothetical protein